jgi:ubiquitin-protein ligase
MNFNKRLLHDIRQLEYSNNNKYIIDYNPSNFRCIEAYIKAPDDSLYSSTFIKLRITVPDNYPIVNPKVEFVKYNCACRIHPNLYDNGKICLSILGTWSGPGWSSIMNLETILLTIQSLLDNEPYKHEPNQSNNENYNIYVRNTSLKVYMEYLRNETNDKFKNFLLKWLIKDYSNIMKIIEKNESIDNFCVLPYGITPITANWFELKQYFKTIYDDTQDTVDEVDEMDTSGDPDDQIELDCGCRVDSMLILKECQDNNFMNCRCINCKKKLHDIDTSMVQLLFLDIVDEKEKCSICLLKKGGDCIECNTCKKSVHVGCSGEKCFNCRLPM